MEKKGGYEQEKYGDRIHFEGLFLNGCKNGYGKEYYNGKLRYEGNWKNDLRHGMGKLLSNDGSIIFEGEFFYNKVIKKNNEIKISNGNAIEYDELGKKIFEGEYKYGKRNGHGKEYINFFIVMI